MEIKETVVLTFSSAEDDSLEEVSSLLASLHQNLDCKNKDFISDGDGWGFTREDICRTEEIIAFLRSSEEYILD